MSYHPEGAWRVIILQQHLDTVVFGSILIQFCTGLFHLFPCSSRDGLLGLAPHNLVFIFFLLIDALFGLLICSRTVWVRKHSQYGSEQITETPVYHCKFYCFRIVTHSWQSLYILFFFCLHLRNFIIKAHVSVSVSMWAKTCLSQRIIQFMTDSCFLKYNLPLRYHLFNCNVRIIQEAQYYHKKYIC